MTGPSGNFNTRPRYSDLPNIPANAYQRLSNLADAIDTANTKLQGHADKLKDITTSTNNAVNDVKSTSKGQATDTLEKVWQDSQTDLSLAQGQLEQITSSSDGLGPIQSDGQTGFRATLDMSKATIQKGVQALENIQNQQNGHATTLATDQQLEQWKQEVDDLNNSMSNLNLIIDGLAMLIAKLNDGFSSACATGFTPGGKLPTFTKREFANQKNENSSGDSSKDPINHIIEKVGDEGVALDLMVAAENAGIDLNAIADLLDDGMHPDVIKKLIQKGINLNDIAALEKDPQTGTVSSKSKSEAESILEAEAAGIVKDARRPNLANGEPNLDFVVNGGYADIKTPINPSLRAVDQQAKDIARSVGHYSANVLVIVDLKNLGPADKSQLRTALEATGVNMKNVRFINE